MRRREREAAQDEGLERRRALLEREAPEREERDALCRVHDEVGDRRVRVAVLAAVEDARLERGVGLEEREEGEHVRVVGQLPADAVCLVPEVEVCEVREGVRAEILDVAQGEVAQGWEVARSRAQLYSRSQRCVIFSKQ